MGMVITGAGEGEEGKRAGNVGGRTLGLWTRLSRQRVPFPSDGL